MPKCWNKHCCHHCQPQLISLSSQGSCWRQWKAHETNAWTEGLWRRRQSRCNDKESVTFPQFQSKCVWVDPFNLECGAVLADSQVSVSPRLDHSMSNVYLHHVTLLVTSVTLWQKKAAMSHQPFLQVWSSHASYMNCLSVLTVELPCDRESSLFFPIQGTPCLSLVVGNSLKVPQSKCTEPW